MDTTFTRARPGTCPGRGAARARQPATLGGLGAGCRLLLAACLLAGLLSAPAHAGLDLRVLVDVSGSMRHNDPLRLRAPALRLLVELLPEEARAGIWTFGEDVSPVVPTGSVDARWRRRAIELSRRLPADEQWTDIEQALTRATDDWEGAADGDSRHVVLLTDGLVDVGPDPGRDAASRARIRGEVLSRLQRAGASIHTVALSDNADRELLAALSLQTDGWMERVADAAELNRVFLRLFEKAAPAEQVPISADNSFPVDSAIRDMTLVVFREPGAAPTGLVDPSGTAHTASSALPEGMRWRAEKGYDLITVERPEAGTWRIDAARDPDNRVLVVTNVSLGVDPLPNHAMIGRSVRVRARLLEEDTAVTREDLLSLIRFEARIGPPGGDGKWLPLAAEPGSGSVRGLELPVAGDPGVREVRVRADGGTFVREHRHQLRVHVAPGEVALEPTEDGGHRVVAHVIPGVVRLETVRATVRSLTPAGAALDLEQVGPEDWALDLDPGLAGAMVEMAVTGQRQDGEPFALQVEQLVPAPEPEVAEAEVAPPPAEPVAEAPPWRRIWALVGLVNLFLWPLVGGAAWWWRQRRRRREAALAEALAL